MSDVHSCTDCTRISERTSLCFKFETHSSVSSYLSHLGTALPPSISLSSIGLPNNTTLYGHLGSGRIAYYIEAATLKQGIPQALIWREVRLVPTSNEAGPPICISDFPSEYVTASTLRQRLSLCHSTSQIVFTAAEPRPFEVSKAHNIHFTRLCLQVRTCSDAGVGGHERPLQAKVSWTLRSSTHMKVMNQAHASKAQHEESSNFLVLKKKKEFSSSRYRIMFSDWHQHDLGRLADAELWISLPCDRHIEPTFSAPFLQRRYSIFVDIEVAQIGYKNVQLELPVQVAYRDQIYEQSSHICQIPDSVAPRIIDPLAEETIIPRETSPAPMYFSRRGWQ